MVRISGKWDHLGTSIFSLMTQRAQANGAVNLAQGFPDFDGPTVVIDAAVAALRGGRNQYAPAIGVPELRRALVKRQEQRTGLAYDADHEVTVFSGATEALFAAMQALLEPGDELLAFEPYYDSYPAAAQSAQAKIVGVPLQAPDFRLDAEALGRAITPKTRGIIVNTPHNPTGRVFTLDELTVVAQVALKHDLFVITDEVYEELVFDQKQHICIATLPNMRERTLVISSTAKTFSFTGWKVGYGFAPPELTKPWRGIHQFTVFCSATPLQVAMTTAVQLSEDYFAELRRSYQAKRDFLVQALRRSGFQPSVPEGTYFVLADYSALAPDKTDVEFAFWLNDAIKVATIPVSAFASQPEQAAKTSRYVRFAFCKGDETLAQGAENLRKLRP